MRILLISAYFPPENGSAANLYHSLGQELVRRGHTVTVLTGMPAYHVTAPADRYLGRWFMREEMDGMRVVRVRALPFSRKNMAGRGLWQLTVAGSLFFGGLFARRQDVALVYSPPLFLGLTAWGLRLIYGTPFMLNVHDLFPQSAIDLGALRNPSVIRALRMVEKFVYRCSNKILVHAPIGPGTLDLGLPAAKVGTFLNWVDTNTIVPAAKENALRKELGMEGRFLVSFAGVLGLAQDGDVMLEAAARLGAKPQIRFLIVGDGLEAPRLKKKAQDLHLNNVLFLPMQSLERYKEVLAASDVCLVTLRREIKTPVIPSKLGSIFAAGRPVVACLPPENQVTAWLIDQAGAGIFLPSNDSEALARSIESLRKNRYRGEKMGRAARVFAEKRLSLETTALRLEIYIQETLSQT